MRTPSARARRPRLARWLAAAGAAMVVATAAHHADAFCRTTTCNPKKATCRTVDGCSRTGAPLTWTVMPIPYRFHARPPAQLDRDEARGAIRLAFKRWTEAVCDNGRHPSLSFQEGPEIPATTPRGKEYFGIYFRDDTWPHNDSEETLALTTQYFGPSSGEIKYSDIEINSGQKKFTMRDNETGTDLESVITHEAGHYIGLAHSPAPGSIMAPSYCQDHARCEGKSKAFARDLGADDVAAVCAIYPPDGTYANEPDPTVGCAVTRTPTSPDGAAIAIVGLVGVVFAVACRRRFPAQERRASIALGRDRRIDGIGSGRTLADPARVAAPEPRPTSSNITDRTS